MSTCTNYKYDNISGTTLLQPHLTVFRMKSKEGLGLPICEKDHKYYWFVENKWQWNTQHQWINHWCISLFSTHIVCDAGAGASLGEKSLC